MASDEYTLPSLYMLWPRCRLATPPSAAIPSGYTLRSYIEGDEGAINNLFAMEEWSLTEEQWQEFKDKLLPGGLFLLFHSSSSMLVGTISTVHNPKPGRYYFPFGGELGDLLVHPVHRGQGLGYVLSVQAVQRFLSVGYDCIRVAVQGFRLAAIKTYFRVGFVPFLHHEEVCVRWQRICDQIKWPYNPETWPKALHEKDIGVAHGISGSA